MTESQKFLLTLVRMALWGHQEALPEEKPDWEAALTQAKRQTLVGLVAEAIPMLPVHLQPDPGMKTKFLSYAIQIVQSHSVINQKLADVKKRLDEHKVHSVLLKGQGVASYYPNPQTRQCGDIDIYVGDDNFAKAIEILNPGSGVDISKYRNEKHYDFYEGGVDIEIHRIAELLPSLKGDRLFQQWTINHLCGPDIKKIKIDPVLINTPSPQFNAIYIMNHAWHHFMIGGIGLRQLCDWVMFLHKHHKNIDLVTLERDLENFDLTRAWQIFASVAVKHFALPAEECPLYSSKFDDKSFQVMNVILNEGNFGNHSGKRKAKRPKSYFASKFYSFRNNTMRFVNLWNISQRDVLNTWIFYFIRGMRNLFVKI